MRTSLLSLTALALLPCVLAPTRAAADVGNPIMLTCPAPITNGADPGACSALVTYADPGFTGGNGTVTVTCVPPSGSLFPVGVTTVHCSASDPSGQMVSCQFTVTVQDLQAPTCRLCFITVNSPDCTSALTLVASSAAGAPFPFGSVAFAPRITDNCPNVQGDVTRSDGQALDALYPVGDTVLTQVAADAAGNQSQCTATVTVLPAFVRLASQVYVQYEVPAPGGPIELAGPAELRLDVNFPGDPLILQDPTRIHTLINLHDVVATWNRVEYHAANNVEADLTANQLSPISLAVPGRYKFEAQGQAAVHSFSLDMPLGAVITAGALSSASFGQPQLAQP